VNRAELAEVVLAASGDGIVVFDRELVCSYWNAAIERMLGIEATHVLGGPLPAELLALLGPEAAESLARVFAGDELHLDDCAYPRRDGGAGGPPVYFEASYVPWRGPDQRVVGGIGILRDTSRRREAERRAAETESRFRTMADIAPVLLWMAGTDALCTFFNQTWLDFTGRTLEDEWGVGWAEGVHHEDFQRCVDTYMEAFTARRTFEMEYRLRRHDGQYRWVLDRGTPRYAPDGAFEGYIGSCVDITDRKDIELDLVRAVRLRDEFLSIASHELRTPITALQLQLDSVARSLERRAEEHLASGRLNANTADARRQVARLRALVERLLDISRFSDGRFSLDREQVDLTQLVGHVVEVMREPARLAGCDLVLQPCPSVRGAWDRVRVEQVVTNLVSNALKFGAGRPIEVSLGEQAGAARLAVRDHGVGIDPRYHQRIFRRFERAVSSRNFGGLGLGLWVAKEIVDAHSGTISVESVPGEGATFVVTLPLVATSKLRRTA
jgi:PAS domain S-box-containing protein